MDKKMKTKLLVIYLFCIIASIICGINYPIALTLLMIFVATQVIIAKIKYYNDSRKYIIYSFVWSLIGVAIFILVLVLVTTFKLEAIRKIILFQL